MKDGVFGTVVAWLYSIEFQKRGLPHVHILVWLTPDAKIRPDNLDCIVSAEIPSPTTEPNLFKLVKSNMIHGPCGPFRHNSPCMKEGKCTKQFPKQFRESTEYGNDGYPKYKRQSPEQGGNTINATSKGINGEIIHEEIDNRFVVPYNKWLLRQMECHTNVEVCSSVKAIKYVLKYVTKGSDQAVYSIQLQDSNDEILAYEEARYVGSMEAAHRILGFPIHEHWPPVTQLAIHLENGQRVYFTAHNAQAQASAEAPKTTLTQFMSLCKTDNFAKTLLYHQVPTYYTWKNKTWSRRKQGVPHPDHPDIRKGPMLGRVYTIHPNLSECYHLRMLLHTIQGPESFDFLRQVDGVQFDTYREACLERGLLADDKHLSQALEESCTSDNPSQIRSLFAVIITTCDPLRPMELWDKFKDAMSEDLAHAQSISLPYPIAIHQKCLGLIQERIVLLTGKDLQQFGLPAHEMMDEHLDTIEYNRYTNFNTVEQQAILDDNLAKLNPEQRLAFDNFRQRVTTQSTGILFLDAPGGTGKTFVIKLILASVRAEGELIIVCASSGIAATLLTGGRTIHSVFKVPLNLHIQEQPTCSIKKGTTLARIINDCRAMVIDEAPMTHTKAYEAIDRTLRDIRDNNNNEPFGGIPTLLCGDFRQILPVVRQGSRPIIVDATLKKSYLWQCTDTIQLKTNMRVQLLEDPCALEYSTYLRQVGDGVEPVIEQPDMISVEHFQTVNSTKELIDNIFPNIQDHDISNSTYFLDKAILAPLNDTVNAINDKIIETFPGEAMTYLSMDSTMLIDDSVHYPPEFLNSIELSGVPPHRLTLKIGCPVIIMRSIDPPHLTNGTRCVVTRTHRNVLEVLLLHGPSAQETKFIPRIPIIPSDSDLPFQFKRIQFPLKPCFALTINKAQGQSFQTIGLHLEAPIFTHGMLYVALSRVGNRRRVTIFTDKADKGDKNITRNVVYKEVL